MPKIYREECKWRICGNISRIHSRSVPNQDFSNVEIIISVHNSWFRWLLHFCTNGCGNPNCGTPKIDQLMFGTCWIMSTLYCLILWMVGTWTNNYAYANSSLWLECVRVRIACSCSNLTILSGQTLLFRLVRQDLQSKVCRDSSSTNRSCVPGTKPTEKSCEVR